MLNTLALQDRPIIVHAPSLSEPDADPLEALESLAEVTSRRRGQTVHGREVQAEYLYRVVSGLARDCALLADGKRQIVDFLMPGDFFGFTPRNVREFTVEAVVDDTVVGRYPRQRVELLADSNPRLGRRLREMAFEAASRSQARMLILGRMSAIEKVGLFLLEMAERSSESTGAAVVLPMSRYDIADYLALSGETVCRALTDLKDRGAIKFAGAHRVRIIDHHALNRRYVSAIHTRTKQPSVMT